MSENELEALGEHLEERKRWHELGILFKIQRLQSLKKRELFLEIDRMISERQR